MLKRNLLFLLVFMGGIAPLSAQLSPSDVLGFESLLAKKNYRQALIYMQTIDSVQLFGSIEKAHSQLLLSKVYQESHQFQNAGNILDSLLNSKSFIKHHSLLAETWFQKGMLADAQNKESEAVAYFLKVDSMTNHKNIAPEFQLRALTTIGDLLFQWRYMKISSGYSKPSHFYEKALKVAEHTSDSSNWYTLKLRLAFLAAGNPAKKLEPIPPIFKKGLAYFKERNEIIPLLEGLHRFAKLHTIRGNTVEAENLYIEYIRIAKENNLQDKEALGNFQYAILLESSNRLPEAIIAYEKAKELYESEKPMLSPTNYCGVLGALAGLYRKTGRPEEAYDRLALFHNTMDSLDAVAQTDRVKELDSKYKSAEKDKEITLLEVENQKKNVQILLVLLIGLLIAAVALFYLYRQRNKIKYAKRVSELDDLKRTFFANISHEFRTPLTLIKSPVQQLRSRKDENIENQLNLIDTNTNRMLELVDQLLELSKIDSGQLQIILKKGSLTSFLNNLLEPFQFQAKESKVHFEAVIKTGEAYRYFDKDIFTKIITNLLSNAFKYHEKGTLISFHSFIKDQTFHFEVSNNDSQLKENDLKKMFERFFQKNNSENGAGIGLALVKDLVALYGGTIKPSLANGTLLISVALPLDKNKKNAVIIEENNTDYSSKTPVLEHEDLPVLLIADDNADIRTVLATVFTSEFVIFQAENGKEAYEIAQKEIPDCIIADVMMPEMNGYMLTKELKENELTASVPVILLTAKTGDEAQLKGLHSLADAYLTKPFNHEIIKATVAQQLRERKKMQERYSRELILKPVGIVINSADEKFIERLETVLETELTNSDFTAEAFAEKMYLSRMQLHRKLKMMFGVSATEFIRNERLKAATDLLGGTLSVSEIAYSIGFNDVGYFSKSFKELYGLPPSEYQKENN